MNTSKNRKKNLNNQNNFPIYVLDQEWAEEYSADPEDQQQILTVLASGENLIMQARAYHPVQAETLAKTLIESYQRQEPNIDFEVIIEKVNEIEKSRFQRPEL